MEHLIDTCWGDDAEHQKYLNKKASEGWELVNVIREKESTFYKYFFKKNTINKDLQHHKDTTVGLYDFDKNIDDIFEKIPYEKGCKTSVEAYLVHQIEHLKSIIFQIK